MSTLGGEDAVSFDSVLEGAQPVVKRARICLRGDLVDELTTLEAALAEAQVFDLTTNEADEAPAIAARIVELTDQARASEVEFVFQSLGRVAWRDLVAAHPPADEDRGKGADFDRETFPPAAMAASCVAPTGATLEKFVKLRDSNSLGDLQWNTLWLACHQANTGGSMIPLSEAAFALALGSETNTAQRGTTASPEASS